MAKFDWNELKKEFLLGDYKSLKEFAEKKGLKYNSDFRKKAAGWREEKLTRNRQKTDKIIEKVIEKQIEQEVDWNTAHLNAWGELLNIINEILKARDEQLSKDGKLNIYALEKIANILEKIQKGQRLALGLDSQTETSSDSLKELVEAIKESAKECEQQ